MAVQVFSMDEVSNVMVHIPIKDLMELIQQVAVQPLLLKMKELQNQVDEATTLFKSGVGNYSSMQGPAVTQHAANIVISTVTTAAGEPYELAVSPGTLDLINRAASARAAMREILLFVYSNDLKSLGLLYRSFKNRGNERYEGAALFPEYLENAIVVYIRDTWYPTILKDTGTWNAALSTKTVDTLGIILTTFRKAAKAAGLMKEIESPQRNPTLKRAASNDSDTSPSPKRLCSTSASGESTD